MAETAASESLHLGPMQKLLRTAPPRGACRALTGEDPAAVLAGNHGERRSLRLETSLEWLGQGRGIDRER